MRFLVVTSSYPRFEGDASGHFVKSEVDELLALGHDVTVVAGGCTESGTSRPMPDSPVAAQGRERIIWLGGATVFQAPGAWERIRLQPARGAIALFVSWKAHRTVRSLTKQRFDAVIAHWLFPAAFPWGQAALRRFPASQVVLHGSDVRLLLSLPSALQYALLHHLKRNHVRLRFVAEHLRLSVLQSLATTPLRTWLEEAEVRPAALLVSAAETKEEARRLLGVDDRERIVVLVGRLIPNKRMDVALRAASLIPEATTIVLGDGPLRSTLEQRFSEARFLGMLPRKEALLWIQASDVLLSASRLEGAPTTIREALALETSVVAVRWDAQRQTSKQQDAETPNAEGIPPAESVWLVD